MAVYNRLLINEGGGVQDENQKAEQEDCLSICIGLGGTGRDAVRQLKKKVYKYLKSDDPASPVPVYRNIKFLVVDSEPGNMDTSNIYDIDQNSEYFDISFPNIRAMLNSGDIIERLKELSWLNYKNILINDLEHGTGGVRQIGRLCLIEKAGEFKEKLTRLLQDGTRNTHDKIRIHIFSGLSGGTGGGTFLDACYIIRHVLEELGKTDALINGYFFLPDVTLSVPGAAGSSFLAKHLKGRGYAALKELDYLMNLEENHDRFVQDYRSFKINTNHMPVDLCNLISSIASDGVAVENGYDYALNTAADYVISFLIKGSFCSDPLKPAAAALTEKKRAHGAVYEYNFISATNVEFPAEMIRAYLGAKLFELLHSLFDDHIPTEKDLENFVSENNLSFQQLFDQLNDGITRDLLYPENIKKATDMIPGDKRVIDYADTWIARALGTLEGNQKVMAVQLKDYHIPKEPTSVIARIFSSLYAAAMDPSKGPIFAANLLGGQNNRNLLHIIDNYMQMSYEYLEAESRREPLLEQELVTAEEKLAKASFINRRNRIDNYLFAVNRWYIHLAVMDSHKVMKILLSTLRDQLRGLYYEFFYPMTSVLNALNHTFYDNNRIYQCPRFYKTPCTWPVPDLADVQTYLDSVVHERNPSNEIQDLVQSLFDNWQSWIREDENKITVMISQYINQKFAHITNKDIEYWMKFANSTPASVIKNLLDQSLMPCLWENPRFNFGNVKTSDILVIPECYRDLAVVKTNSSLTPRLLHTKNWFSLIRMYRTIPLFAWQGLEELEKVYEENPFLPGLHLYEAGSVDWREYLPSPYPASFRAALSDDIPRIRERDGKLTKELQEALQTGIVRCDYEGLHILQSKTKDTWSLLDEVHRYGADGQLDMLKLTDLLDRLRTVREQMYGDGNVEEITLRALEPVLGREEQILSDNYLRCPVLQKIVREELRKLRGINGEISKLEGHCPGTRAPVRPNRREDFFSAVFTGVIELKKDRILFSYEQFDLEIALELQNCSMPYGTKAPLYQAYLTYEELDTDLLEMIVKKTNDTLDNMNDEIYEKSKQLQARYTSDFLKMTLSRVATDFRREEIAGFYSELTRALQSHIVTYI